MAIREDDEERCSAEFGGACVRACAWSGGAKKCANWCAAHAKEWAGVVTDILDRVEDETAPMALVVDYLMQSGRGPAVFARGPTSRLFPDGLPKDSLSRGSILFARGPTSRLFPDGLPKDSLSRGSILFASCRVSAVGLTGNPPDELCQRWRCGFCPADKLEFAKFEGYRKSVLTVFRAKSYGRKQTKEYSMLRNGDALLASAEEVKKALTVAMSSSNVKGTHLIFEFRMVVTGMEPSEIEAMTERLDEPDPTGRQLFRAISGGASRSYLFEPASRETVNQGGAHLSLEVGDSVAEWHSMASLLLTFDNLRKEQMCAELVMMW
jgi:hypothetical protein